MAIVFNCPQCNHPYRLPDKLAGQKAKCKNEGCRKVIVIPQPPPTPGLTIAELGGLAPESNGQNHPAVPATGNADDIALAALNDAPKQEDAPTGGDIEVTCPHCDHKWTEPAAKAGKNTLCPSEECRQRVKVPIPKKGEPPADWRTGNQTGPSLAKENFEKPTDVVGGEAKIVSKEAWTQGGGAEQDYEPVPLSRKLFLGTLVAVPVLGLLFGGWYLWHTWQVVKDEGLMDTARKEFADSGAADLPPAQAPLFAAVLELATGEWSLHRPDGDRSKDETLADAHKNFAAAREKLREAGRADDPKKPTTAAERDALAAELALAQLGMGGDADQVKAQTRYRWVPDAPDGRQLRVNEKVVTIHQELQKTLQLLQGADFDTKAAVARRLTRELVRKGPSALTVAVDLPVMLFTTPEQTEGKAIVALEIYRLDRGNEKVRQIADELKTQLAGGVSGKNPIPVSAQTLWQAVGTEKAPTVAQQPSAGGPTVSETSRLAYTGTYLLQDKPAEALALAQRPGSLAGQLRSLVVYAEWAADPAPAFDAAAGVIAAQAKGRKDAPPPPAPLVLRLSELAAAAGRPDQAKVLADLIADEGSRVWARGDAVHLAATPENKSAADLAAVEVPDDAKKLRVGHAWGALWVARQTARVKGGGDAKKMVDLWPKGTIRPFGLAGIALGQQER
jgi:hypothetical protein